MDEYQLVPFFPKPGISRQTTRYGEKGRWYDADKVRFREGFPEKIGGWIKYSSSTFEGYVRALFSFQDLSSKKYIAFGTQCFLYLDDGGQFNDITPVVVSGVLSNKLNTTANSLRVVVSATHGITGQSHVVFTQMSATVGGNVFLSGTYSMSVIDTGSYAIDYSASAVATSAATGTVTQQVLLECGTTNTYFGFGFGIGTFGTSAFGTPRSSSSLILEERQWSLDNWGEDLIASPRGGKIYTWVAASGTGQRAIEISAAPSVNTVVFVADQNRHVVAAGTNAVSAAFEPLLVRWCATENYNDWIASATNTAGDKLLDSGSYIVGALNTKNQALIWTDNSLYGMSFSGPPFEFDFNLLGTNCGMIGPHAAVDVDGRTFWWGTDNFYLYDGTVKILDCQVLKYVTAVLQYDQRDKVYAGHNPEFQEVWWFYPSVADGEPDQYVTYNYIENNWCIGTMPRSAWISKGIFHDNIAAGTDGYLYYQDVDDVYDADSSVMAAHIQSAPLEIQEGTDLLFVDKIIPDFDVDGNVEITLQFQKYPAGTTTTKGPFTVTSATEKISMRGRGRQASLRIASSAVGDRWRSGMLRVQVRPDGLN